MAHPNNFKYLKAPTLQQIEAVVQKAGVTEAQFERFHNIPERTIGQIRYDGRDLPVKFWHIIFEANPNFTKPFTRKAHQTPTQRAKVSQGSALSKLIGR